MIETVNELYENELISPPSPEVVQEVARQDARVYPRVRFQLPQWLETYEDEVDDRRFDGVKVHDPFQKEEQQ